MNILKQAAIDSMKDTLTGKLPDKISTYGHYTVMYSDVTIHYTNTRLVYVWNDVH